MSVFISLEPQKSQVWITLSKLVGSKIKQRRCCFSFIFYIFLLILQLCQKCRLFLQLVWIQVSNTGRLDTLVYRYNRDCDINIVDSLCICSLTNVDWHLWKGKKSSVKYSLMYSLCRFMFGIKQVTTKMVKNGVVVGGWLMYVWVHWHIPERLSAISGAPLAAETVWIIWKKISCVWQLCLSENWHLFG